MELGRFLPFYSALAPSDPRCNMLHDFIWIKKYEQEMSDEHSHSSLNLAPSASFIIKSDRLEKKADQSLCVGKDALKMRLMRLG